MSKPKFSIITVCKNSEKTIERTILSVLHQTHTDLEYIIVDGNSTDGTLEIIKKYQPLFSNRLRWKSENDEGIYDAMNKGISWASGEIIGILNSDDWYEPNTLTLINNESKNVNNSVYYGSLRIIQNGVTKKVLTVDHSMLPYTMIPHPTCFVPSSIYSKVGTFNSKYRYAGDLELMLKFKSNNIQFKFIDAILANYEEGGATERYFHSSTKEVFRILYHYKYISKFKMYLHLLNETRREIFK